MLTIKISWWMQSLSLALALSASTDASAQNIDPAGNGSKFAWGENVGWINFAPSFGPGVTVIDSAVAGLAWGENIGWINLSPSFGGVVNDGVGHLSGYAWSENAGWINFSGVSIDACGEFDGKAWGENVGWVSFRSNGPFPFRITTSWTPPSDQTAPVTIAAGPGAGWISTDAVVSLTATDCGNGVRSIHYSIDGGLATIVNGDNTTVTIGLEGEHTLTFFAEDNDGNLETAQTLVVRVDKTSPLITCPPNVFAHPTSAAGTIVIYPPATASDLLDPSPTLSYMPPSGTQFPMGVTTVLATARDHANNVATCSFNVTVANQPPIANPDSVTVNQNTFDNHVDVLANDTDPDADPLVVSSVGTAQHGVVMLTQSGVAYTPAQDFVGSDSFTYTVADGLGGAASSTVSVTVVESVLAVFRVEGGYGHDGCASNPGFDIRLNTEVDQSDTVQCFSGFGSNQGISGPGFVRGRAEATQTGGGTATSMNTSPSFHVPFMLVSNSNDPVPVSINLRFTGTAANQGSAAWGAVYRVDIDEVGLSSGSRRFYGGGGGHALPELDGLTYPFTTGTVMVVPNVRHFFNLMLESSVGVFQFQESVSINAQFTFPTVGPVFNLPPGVVLTDIPALNVVNNHWTDPRVPPDLDTTPPVLSNVPSDFFVEATSLAGAIASYAMPTATDDVDPAPTVSCVPPSGSQFAFGPTSVTCTAADASGNSSQGSFAVTVRDTIPPVLTCPADVTVHATSAAGSIVNYPLATASDNILLGFLSHHPPSGSLFPIGRTTVHVEAADEQDNETRCTFDITVTNGAPTATPDSVTVNEDNGVTAINTLTNDGDPDGDVISIIGVGRPAHGTTSFTASAVSYTPATDYVGLDTFTYTIDDGRGGIAAGSVNVTVLPVNDPPVNTVPGPQGVAFGLPLLFAVASGNPIEIADVDAGIGPMRMTLAATNATITLGRTTGLTFSTGDGTGDPMMIFTGSIVNVNAALDGLRVSPLLGFTSVSLSITTDDQGQSGAGGPQSDTDSIGITVGPTASADISVTITADPLPISVGGVLNYRLQIKNNGLLQATTVTLIDFTPAIATLISAVPSQGSCSFENATHVAQCSLGALANGASASVTVAVKATTRGVLINLPFVLANQADPVTTNNSTLHLAVVR